MDEKGNIYPIDKEARQTRSPEQIKKDQERLREAMRTGPVEILDQIRKLEREKMKAEQEENS